jgi:hypothetical protein
MIPPLQSLVKYDNAVQVSTAHDKKKGAKKVWFIAADVLLTK